MDIEWDISYSFVPDSFAEPGVSVNIWCSLILHGKFPDLFECPRDTLLETHSMDVLVNVDVYSLVTTSLVAERTFFSAPFFSGAILLKPWLETHDQGLCVDLEVKLQG